MKIDWDFLLTTAAWLAAQTQTKVDDAAVDLFRAIQADPMLQAWFGKQADAGNAVEIAPDGTLSFTSDEPPVEVVQALFDGGVFKGAKDLAEVGSKLKDLLPLLLKLAEFAKLFIK